MNSNFSILLVEDDSSCRELIEEVLAEEGYQIESVPNGLEAKKSLKEKQFDLLITDFKMPGLNGVELLKWCRKEEIKSSVLFMTAASHLVADENSALEDTNATLVQKPINLEHFLKTIQSSLNA